MRLSYRPALVAPIVLGSSLAGLPAATAAPAAARPVIISMSPASGGTTANAVAVLHGRNLTHVTGVTFGGERARFTMVSSTVLRAAAPKTYTDTRYAAVRVVTRAGSSNTRNFLYVASPTVTALSSHVASGAGGKRITVSGTNFRSVRAVAFGGVHGRDVHVLSTRKLLVTAPPHRMLDTTVGVITAYGSSVRVTPQSRFVFEDPPVVSGLSVADGSVDGGRRVELRGAGLFAPLSVRFDGQAATIVDRPGGGGSVVVTAPAHPAGSVDVVVSTAVGVSATTSATRFRYGPDNPLTWSGGAVVDPLRYRVTGLSCSETLCAAIGDDGGLYVRDGSGWQETNPLATKPWDSVLCSAGFCSVTDEHGMESHYSAGRWSPPARSWSGAARAMSCVSAASCVAFSTNGQEMDWDGSTWTGKSTTIQNVVALTCTAATECVAVSSDGSAPTRTGNFWTFGARAAPTTLTAAACDPAGGCLVADRNGDWYAHDAGTSGWHGVAAGPVPAGVVGTNLSCASSTSCVLTSRNPARDVIFALRENGVWQPGVIAPGELATLPSCGGVGRCTFARYGPTLSTSQVFDGTSVGSTETIGAVRGDLVALSCSSDTFCVAVDLAGHAVVSRPDGSWSLPTRVADDLFAVSCGADGHCVAISRHAIFSLDDDRWTAVADVPDAALTDVSCVGPSYCVAVDAAGRAHVGRGATWAAPVSVAPTTLTAVSCPGVDDCTALTGSRSVVRLSLGVWGAPRVLATNGPALDSLDCPTSRTCFVGTDDGSLLRVRAADVTSFGKQLPGRVSDLSCASDTFCTAVDGSTRSSVTWDGAFWSATTPVGDGTVRAISCTAHRCVAVDEQSVYTARR